MGILGRTLERAAQVVEAASQDPEIAQEVKAEKVSINMGAQKAKAKRKPSTPPEYFILKIPFTWKPCTLCAHPIKKRLTNIG